MDQHQGRKPEKAEDDPSKRAFDREKDMGLGGIGRSQKKLEDSHPNFPEVASCSIGSPLQRGETNRERFLMITSIASIIALERDTTWLMLRNFGSYR
jgi:hypothetical protein